MATEQSGAEAKKRFPSSIPDVVWAPIAAGLLMAIVGVLGLVAHQPWLFPSLGPTAFLQAEQPEQPTARLYNTIVGHLLGLGSGCIAVLLLGAQDAPGVFVTHELTPVRVGASVLAVALNLLAGFAFKASHPPAAATTLLFALGGFKPSVHDVMTVIVGVAIVAIAGELLRRFRLGKFRSLR